MPIANALPELNYQAGDYSNALYKGAEFKRQQQQDAAVQETRDLTNQGLRKQLDPTNPLNQYAENKARSELGKIMKDDWKTYSMEATTLPDAELPGAYDKLVERFKPYASGAVIDSSAFKNADGTTDTKALREHIKTSIANIDNVGKEGTAATAIVENPAWKTDADTDKGIPHWLKKSGVNNYDGTVKWDASKTEPYLSKWEQTMMAERGKKEGREATAAYRGATLANARDRTSIARASAAKEKASAKPARVGMIDTVNNTIKYYDPNNPADQAVMANPRYRLKPISKTATDKSTDDEPAFVDTPAVPTPKAQPAAAQTKIIKYDAKGNRVK